MAEVTCSVMELTTSEPAFWLYNNYKNAYKAEVKINGQEVKMEIDTGATGVQCRTNGGEEKSTGRTISVHMYGFPKARSTELVSVFFNPQQKHNKTSRQTIILTESKSNKDELVISAKSQENCWIDHGVESRNEHLPVISGSGLSHTEKVYLTMLGGLHIEMAFWRLCGDLLESSGWTTALSESSVASTGTGDSFLKVSHLTRTRHSHLITALVLSKRRHDVSILDNDKQGEESFKVWRADLLKWSPTFKFWNIILQLEIMILIFIKAHHERQF
ncbi:hypothetical protein GQR58_020175 [Nymphon striatum]|nr:hypothetical protein GQR58_020175 [Nymphon striatum]